MVDGVASQVCLGAAVNELCTSILQATKRIIKFESILENLRATVESLTPKINRIAQLKESHKNLEHEICKLMLQLHEAEELIKRCARIHWWNYWKKYRYSKKLLELDASINRSLMYLPVLIWEDTAQILDEIVKLNEKLDRIMHERNAYGKILNLSKAKVSHVVTGLKKIVRSIPIWIYPYLSWFIRLHRLTRGYQRITASFCPNYGRVE